MAKILVTGVAGFIGYHVAELLLARGDEVVGIDDFNPYYDPSLKEARVARLAPNPKFTLHRGDIADEAFVERVVADARPDKICHLAAQAGVRYSLEQPLTYVRSNLVGTTVIFETARRHAISQVVYASSSSVYGNSDDAPFSEDQPTDTPISLYAATKKGCEVIAHSYHHLYGMDLTGLRFFTVYGPWGRPDMSPIKFAERIWKGDPIDVYNHGKMRRDFTYVDDIADGVVRALDRPLGYRIFNLGGSNVAELEHFIATLEKHLGKPAIRNYMDLQPGDVLLTSADTSRAQDELGWKPATSLDEGIASFAAWFKEYYR